ncbi:MAG: hypothetical protein MdMp014T_0450 [Treponematales bacterium]
MKIIKLILFFSLTYALLFAAGAVYHFLTFWVDALRQVPMPPDALADSLAASCRGAVPFALYLSALFALSYTARNGVGAFGSVFWVFVLSAGLTLAFSLGTRRLETIKPGAANPKPLALTEGLILSSPKAQVVLLEGAGGPRITAVPGKPLLYEEAPDAALPGLPFREDGGGFFQSLLVGFDRTAGEFASRLDEGVVPFCVYAGSLIFLLVSFRFLLGVGRWPLANFFWGAVAFRGVLALEGFVNSREIQAFLGGFLGSRVPARLVTPAVFTALGALLLLYTALAGIAGKLRAGGNDG